MPTHYEILRIQQTASVEEVQLAYRRRAMGTHPDRNPNKDSKEFRLIQSAYETLVNPRKRQEYDASIGIGEIDPHSCPQCLGNLFTVTDSTGVHLRCFTPRCGYSRGTRTFYPSSSRPKRDAPRHTATPPRQTTSSSRQTTTAPPRSKRAGSPLTRRHAGLRVSRWMHTAGSLLMFLGMMLGILGGIPTLWPELYVRICLVRIDTCDALHVNDLFIHSMEVAFLGIAGIAVGGVITRIWRR